MSPPSFGEGHGVGALSGTLILQGGGAIKSPGPQSRGPSSRGGGTPRTSPCAPLIWLFTHVLPNIFSSTGELFPKLRCKLPNRVGVVTSGLQPVTQKHRRHAGVRGGGVRSGGRLAGRPDVWG